MTGARLIKLPSWLNMLLVRDQWAELKNPLDFYVDHNEIKRVRLRLIILFVISFSFVIGSIYYLINIYSYGYKSIDYLNSYFFLFFTILNTILSIYFFSRITEYEKITLFDYQELSHLILNLDDVTYQAGCQLLNDSVNNNRPIYHLDLYRFRLYLLRNYDNGYFYFENKIKERLEQSCLKENIDKMDINNYNL